EDHYIGDATLVRQHVGQRDRMIDVGRRVRILATLRAVLVSSESHCLYEHTDGVRVLRHPLVLSLFYGARGVEASISATAPSLLPVVISSHKARHLSLASPDASSNCLIRSRSISACCFALRPP